MLQIKVGVQLASLRLPFRQALLTAREMGADAVEIDAREELKGEELSVTGIRQIRKMLEDLNLRVAAVRFRTRRGYDVQQDLDERVDATRRTLKLAYDLGTHVVINHVGRIPAEVTHPAFQTMVDALTDIGRHGQRVGAMLAAETVAESGADLKRLIDALPPASIGVNLNPAPLIMNGHSPREVVDAVGQHVLHMNATDATRDLSLAQGIETPLGYGSAEIPELLAVLEEHQYRGYFTVERHQSNAPQVDLKQAITFLRNL